MKRRIKIDKSYSGVWTNFWLRECNILAFSALDLVFDHTRTGR